MKTAAPAARGADRPVAPTAPLWRIPPQEAKLAAPPLPIPNRHARPWPINEDEIDLPDGTDYSASLGWNPDRHYLGSLLVQQRQIHGRLSLDVDALTDALCLEIGPYRLDRHQTAHLLKLLKVALALMREAP